MPSTANPHLFRFEDNIGAILTSFPRVIRRAAGMMNQYGQAVGDKVVLLIGKEKIKSALTKLPAWQTSEVVKSPSPPRRG